MIAAGMPPRLRPTSNAAHSRPVIVPPMIGCHAARQRCPRATARRMPISKTGTQHRRRAPEGTEATRDIISDTFRSISFESGDDRGIAPAQAAMPQQVAPGLFYHCRFPPRRIAAFSYARRLQALAQAELAAPLLRPFNARPQFSSELLL